MILILRSNLLISLPLALQVALVHPDHGVEAATSLREEAANPGLKNPELEEIALDLDLL